MKSVQYNIVIMAPRASELCDKPYDFGAHYLASLSISFLICKVGMLFSPSEEHFKGEMR